MINKKIEMIASLIDNDKSVIDIGCDHGYLSLLLRKQGNNKLLINSDNKIGPLNSAKENLKDYENILFFCCDGLNEDIPQVDVINIAGMGYHTVIHILQQNISYVRKTNSIIIQVNSDVDKMRRWLINNNFKITNEKIVFDYKYYQIIVVENGKQILTEEEIEFGPFLLKEKDKCFIDYLISQKNNISNIISNISNNDEAYTRLNNKLNRIEKILKD